MEKSRDFRTGLRVLMAIVAAAAPLTFAGCGDDDAAQATLGAGGSGTGSGAGAESQGGGPSACAAPDVTAVIPAERLADWTPGVSVGVPGGIRHRTELCATVQRAPDSPQTTTGTAEAGSSQLTVSSVADFVVGHGIRVTGGACQPYSDPCAPADFPTTITAIDGTTLTLRAPLTNAVSDALVWHDDAPAIQDAITDCPDDHVVYLPAGTYRIYGGLATGYRAGGLSSGYKSNITIRGDGDSTVIDSYARSGSVISIGGGDSYQWNFPNLDILESPAKGSDTLTVGDTSWLDALPEGGVGTLAQVSLMNDPELPVISVAVFEYLRKQKVRIVGKTATTITISPPLHFDLPAGLMPKLNVAALEGETGAQVAEFVGIEDLKLDMTNSIDPADPNSKAAFGISMSQAYGSWLKNVTVINTPNYLVSVGDSLACEIRGCWLSTRVGGGSNGAGLLMGGSNSCLVEDNVIEKIGPHMEINAGSSGNVFAYNFAENNFAGTPGNGIMGQSFDSNHGPHNSYNLWEGNVGSVFQSDGYFGGESEGTLFRNWFHGTCDTSEPTTDQFGRAVHLSRFSRNFSVVGNILGRAGYPFTYDNANDGASYGTRYAYILGLPNIGNGGFNGMFAPPWPDFGGSPGPGGFQELDTDVAATTIRKGNWNAQDSAVPESESLDGATLPNSLYLCEKPEWFGDLEWPPFDAQSPPDTSDGLTAYRRIPAGQRWVDAQ
jgi:hypothetical protein